MKKTFFYFSILGLLAAVIISCQKPEEDPEPENPGGADSTDVPVVDVVGEGIDSLTHILDIYYPSETEGYVVGKHGVIFKTTDGGISFQKQTSGVSEDLYSVYFSDLNNGLAVGNKGTFLKTSDGGSTWTDAGMGISRDLREVYFLDNLNGFIGGSDLILATKDGGATWSEVDFDAYDVAARDFCFTNDTVGYATADNYMLKTIDGGATWESVSTSISGPANIIVSVSFVNDNLGFACGGNTMSNGSSFLLKTTDAGETWSEVSQPAGQVYLTRVGFISPSTGYVVGGDIDDNTSTILKTTDGGTTWSVVPSDEHRLVGAYFQEGGKAHAAGLNGSYVSLN